MIFYQDLKYRQIHILLPIILLGLGMFEYIYSKHSYTYVLQSLLFLTITLLAGYLYIIIKNKKIINPFKTIMGIGDIFFFIAVLPFFITENYILYFITGMFFSLLSFLLLKVFYKKINTVPLAGLLALYLIMIKVYSFCFGNFNFFTSIL